jgi:hypothetical protein
MTTVEEMAKQIVNEVESCDLYGDDMRPRYKRIATEIVSKLLTTLETKVREKTITLVFDHLFGKEFAKSDEGKTLADIIQRKAK